MQISVNSFRLACNGDRKITSAKKLKIKNLVFVIKRRDAVLVSMEGGVD